MANIIYFCTVKAITTVVIALFLLARSTCLAQETTASDTSPLPPAHETVATDSGDYYASMDSVHISLLTCTPFEAIYALYGHTAIRVQDLRNGMDIAVNYGCFDFEAPFFALRFVFGLTDYEMGVEYYRDLRYKYKYFQCSIIQQEINLKREEKAAILAAMGVNILPENRVYRYNYFYDNCTTRARDIIVNNLNGYVTYGEEPFEGPTFRQIVHGCTDDYPWARFGDDFLLGVKADMSTTRTEYQFLPANLMTDFGNAVITDLDGTKRPLVKSTTVVLDAPVRVPSSEFPLSPTACAVILLLVTIVITVTERLTRHTLYIYDALLMTLCGLSGIILFAMIFSQHPTVSLNFQLLLLNPLPLFFIYRMIKRTRRHTQDWQYKMWTALIVLAMIGGIWQNYAEGMYLIALSLLIRNIVGMARTATYGKPLTRKTGNKTKDGTRK